MLLLTQFLTRFNFSSQLIRLRRILKAANLAFSLTCITVLSPLAHSVSAQGQSKMYWSDRIANTIMRANLDGSNPETLVSLGQDEKQARGVAVDHVNHRLYWADNGANKIQRSMLDGSQVEDIVTGLNFPAGVALDVGNNKVYWVDANNKKIQRANLDGSGVKDIVTGLGTPYYITVDTVNGQLYWTDYGTDKIQRSNLDGTNIVDLVTTGLQLPRGVDIDLENQMLYWADRTVDVLQRSNLDGSNIETIHHATPSSAAPHGVALDHVHDHIYWVDNGLVTIKRANLDGSEPVTILDGSNPFLQRPWQIVLDVRQTPPVDCAGLPECTPWEPGLDIDAVTVDIVNGQGDEKNDYNRDGRVDLSDRTFLIHYVLNSFPGDANVDGFFDSKDLVTVFVPGEYEDDVAYNSTWASGDWNGDQEFTSQDFVVALQAGHYEATSPVAATVPEPSVQLLCVCGLLVSSSIIRRRGPR